MAPLVVTGQQIGVGWTPALSVVKALSALAFARQLGGEAVYWLADEDHDHQEVASTVAVHGKRILRHRFQFGRPPGTATGWLPWTDEHQRSASELWGEVPVPVEPTLGGHVLALGTPLWERGLRPFSPTRQVDRPALQEQLHAWRAMDLHKLLVQQAAHLTETGAALPLDPNTQAAWFSLHPATGQRRRLDPEEPCPQGTWLSPGAALRPLMQSLVLPVTHVVLGPAERAYWRLAEPLWERLRLEPPRILPRPSVYVLPQGLSLEMHELEALRLGQWQAFAPSDLPLPSAAPLPQPSPDWPPELSHAFGQELSHLRSRLGRLDRRLHRHEAARRMGMDPEAARQALFPLGRPQERVLPGLYWLRQPALLDHLMAHLAEGTPLHLVSLPQ